MKMTAVQKFVVNNLLSSNAFNKNPTKPTTY